jgi:hypothetical protein
LALERKKHDLFIQSVLEKPHQAEARAWLKAELRPKSRSLAKFATTKGALKFVEQLYSADAAAVIVAAISTGQRKKLFADWLLIQLPATKSKRNSLRKICQAFCRKRGGAILPEFDMRETHLWLMLHG